jgi:hypothetical protein
MQGPSARIWRDYYRLKVSPTSPPYYHCPAEAKAVLFSRLCDDEHFSSTDLLPPAAPEAIEDRSVGRAWVIDNRRRTRDVNRWRCNRWNRVLAGRFWI